MRKKGFTKATLGMETGDTKNKVIYCYYGFSKYIKSGREYYPDGTAIDVEYYGKSLIEGRIFPYSLFFLISCFFFSHASRTALRTAGEGSERFMASSSAAISISAAFSSF